MFGVCHNFTDQFCISISSDFLIGVHYRCYTPPAGLSKHSVNLIDVSCIQITGDCLDGVSWSILDAGDGHIICIVCVYLPCFSGCNKYFTQLEFYLGFIENVIQNYDEIIILGDFNFPCKPGHPAFDKVNSVFSQYDISHCDNLLTNPLDSQFSYVNLHLGQKSLIDHFFVCNKIRPRFTEFRILDSGANLSDHLPVIGLIDLPASLAVRIHSNGY